MCRCWSSLVSSSWTTSEASVSWSPCHVVWYSSSYNCLLVYSSFLTCLSPSHSVRSLSLRSIWFSATGTHQSIPFSKDPMPHQQSLLQAFTTQDPSLSFNTLIPPKNHLEIPLAPSKPSLHLLFLPLSWSFLWGAFSSCCPARAREFRETPPVYWLLQEGAANSCHQNTSLGFQVWSCISSVLCSPDLTWPLESSKKTNMA